MSDNQGNPLQGSETDVQKAQKAINGLLEPKQEAKAKVESEKMIMERENSISFRLATVFGVSKEMTYTSCFSIKDNLNIWCFD